MDTYERIDIRQRAKELTDIEYGKRKDKPKVVNLLNVLWIHLQSQLISNGEKIISWN